MRERRIKGRVPSIYFYGGGVKIDASSPIDNRQEERGGIRGEVKGWSSASRRRMRHYLLTKKPREGMQTLGATFTVPGPPITPAEASRLFDHFSKNYIVRNGCGMVWRLEIQKRGAVHWHGIVAFPDPLHRRAGKEFPPKVALRLWWLHALRVLGKVEWKQEYEGGTLSGNSTRDNIEGAAIHSVDVQNEGDRGAWLRYLQDHATKTKQEQVATGFGRHWGVVGRACFESADPESSHKFSSIRAFWRFLRAYHRLTQPVMSWRKRREVCAKYQGRPFAGRSLGWSSNRGSLGVSVWFSKPETVRRLVEWAESVPD